MQVNGEVIMRDFMQIWLNNICLHIMCLLFDAQTIEVILKQEYENTLKAFETFLQSLQKNDLGNYFELKKIFQQTYELNSKRILEMCKNLKEG